MTTQTEQIVFADFAVGHGCVLLVRVTPDSMGGRMAIVPFEQLTVVKFTEALSEKSIRDLGFHGAVAKAT